MHNIATVEHLSPKPVGAYPPSAPVKITYLNGGGVAFSSWGSDVGDGGVLAWRAAGGQAIAYQAPVENIPVVDLETLNLALVQEGSVLRAVALIMFDEINKLRVKNGDPAYTLTQFKTALIAKMRT